MVGVWECCFLLLGELEHARRRAIGAKRTQSIGPRCSFEAILPVQVLGEGTHQIFFASLPLPNSGVA